MDRVLIIGASGLVGKALSKELAADYDVYGTYHSQENHISGDKILKFDVNDADLIKSILDKVRPNIVISCLRGDFENQLNVHRIVAEYLNKTDGMLYFCSTANVFDNDVSKPHCEEDNTNAISEYGSFKAKTEEMLMEVLKENVCVLRLPMIWGKDSPRLNNLLRQLENNDSVEVYNNLYLNNNTDVMVAKQIRYIMKNDLKGIFHLGTVDIINHKDFICDLVSALGYKVVKLKEEALHGEKQFLALASDRQELPKEFRITNMDIINYLVE